MWQVVATTASREQPTCQLEQESCWSANCSAASSVASAKIDTSRFLVRPNGRLSLSQFDPADTAPFASRKGASRLLKKSARELYRLTELLFAQNRWSVLFVFQAMDGAGKDSAIKHVLRGLDPKATQVFSFKDAVAGGAEARLHVAVPEGAARARPHRHLQPLVLRRRAGHPRAPGAARAATAAAVLRDAKQIWRDRFEDIRDIERYLARNGTVIRKIFLNVSKAEQRRRFLMRLHNPEKRWKFSVNDVNERLRWKEYMAAYEEAMRATSTDEAPWYVVPADNKWFTRLAVAHACG